MMLFYKYICEYILEEISINQLIYVAIECVSNGIESDSLYILAGLNEKDEYDISLYYKSALKELKINEPTKFEAVKYLIKYYCNQLINKNITPEIFLEKVVDGIYYNYTAPGGYSYTNDAGYEFNLMEEETKYARVILGLGDRLDWKDTVCAGDFWGLERFVGLYRCIDDLIGYKRKKTNEKSTFIYVPDNVYIDKNNVDVYIEKMYNVCYEYAEEYLNNN
jgi:hypothetical protein